MKRPLGHKTQFAWHPAPFGHARKVPTTEAERWRELDKYAVRPRQSARGDDWTHEEVCHLVTLLDAGHGYDTCAQRLGRSRSAVQIKVKRLRCPMTRRPLVLTAHDGMNCISNIQPLCLSCNASKGTNHTDFREKEAA